MEISDKLTKLLSLKKKKRRKSSQGGEELDDVSDKLDQHLATSCRQFFTKRIEFHCVQTSDSHLEDLKTKYKPLNGSIVKTMEPSGARTPSQGDSGGSLPSSSGAGMDEVLPKPKKELFDSKDLVMEWKQAHSVGAGLYNMGNTCFLNSVLQCLVYTPPLHNYISLQHKQTCRVQGFCVMCEFQRLSTRVFGSPNGCVKPLPIVQNIKAIAKPFRIGRQEDAHEFLRYFIDALQKTCLQGLSPKLDPHSKATTVIHKIFGGYHRSQVKCLECMKTSNTFDPLLDINLDIKNCPTLLHALKRSTQADTLEGENSYACPYCKKMTQAQKKFTIHRLPNILTIQLKRFEYNGLFGGKINKAIEFPEYINMRPYMSTPKGPSEWYRLYAVLVHFGYSSNSGHYYCYIRNSNRTWYCMNDTQVTQVGLSTVLSQEAYLLFYIKDPSYEPSSSSQNVNRQTLGGHPPPRTTTNKVKSDPNFPIKRQQAGLDKMGTPLVKISPKPTGIVNPSPHTATATPTNTHNSPSSSSPLPPRPKQEVSDKTRTTPQEDKTPEKTPEGKRVVSANTSSGSNSSKGSNGESGSNGGTTSSNSSTSTPTTVAMYEGVREFSIPLRKTVITPPADKQREAAKKEEKATSAVANTSATAPTSSSSSPSTPNAKAVKQEDKPVQPAAPLFTPRQVSATSTASKSRKLQLKGVKKSAVVVSHLPLLSRKSAGVEKEVAIPSVKSIAAQNLDQREEEKSSTITNSLGREVKMGDDASKTASATVAQPGFVALPTQAQLLSMPSNSGGETADPQQQQQQPHLSLPPPPPPPQTPPPPPPQRLNSLHMPPFSFKLSKVAMVSPIPQPSTITTSSSSTSTKPVARVKPNLHLSPSPGTKDENRPRGTPTPSTPHINTTSPWTVSSTSPNLPEGKGYDGAAHGWKVTSPPPPPPPPPSSAAAPPAASSSVSSTVSKNRKSKKKRKYRSSKHSEVSEEEDEEASSVSSAGESESEMCLSSSRSSSKKKRHKDMKRNSEYASSSSHSKRRHGSSNRTDYTDEESSSGHHHHHHGSRHRSRSRSREREKERWLHATSTHSSSYYHHHHRHHHHKKHRKSSYGSSRRHNMEREHSEVSGGRHGSRGDEYDHQSRKKSRHSHQFDSTVGGDDRATPTTSPGRGGYCYGNSRDEEEEKYGHRQHHYKHSSSSYHSSEERRRERKRSSHGGGESGNRQHGSRHSPSPGRSEAKRVKLEKLDPSHRREDSSSRNFKMEPVEVLAWDEGGSAKKELSSKKTTWDGTRATDILNQLTSQSSDKLGSQVRSWGGGDNTIDSSRLDGDGKRYPDLDSWDRELDKGKVKKIKRKSKSTFSTDTNAFQDMQNRRNRANRSP